jgi:TolA-binding protein
LGPEPARRVPDDGRRGGAEALMRRTLATVLLLGASGCLATKNDFYTMQREQQALRALIESQDAARQRQADSIARANGNLIASRFNTLQSDQQRLLQTLGDSVRRLAQRHDQMRIMLQDTLISIGNQMATLRGTTGNVGNFIAQLQRSLEANEAATRANEAAIKRLNEVLEVLGRASAGGGGGVSPDTTMRSQPTDPVAGPRQLLDEGKRHLLSRACGTGRQTLQDLLQNYPDNAAAPEALLSIGHSYKDCDTPGNSKKADSVYAEVAKVYPRTAAAALALYGRGIIACSNNDGRAANTYFQQILRDYRLVAGAENAVDQSRQYVANGCF